MSDQPTPRQLAEHLLETILDCHFASKENPNWPEKIAIAVASIEGVINEAVEAERAACEGIALDCVRALASEGEILAAGRAQRIVNLIAARKQGKRW